VVSHTRVENAHITGHAGVGGIVGFNEGTVSNCCWVGTVNGDEYVGGLVGYNEGTVGYSCSSVTVIGRRSVGGLVGGNFDGAINASYSSGNVTCHDTEAGGLVGRNTGTIRDCYTTGSVVGDEYVGGLVGLNTRAIHNCYSTGRVTGKSQIGGLVGFNSYLSTVHNSFWDAETSMRDYSDGGTARTTLAMQNIATYADTATEGLQEPWEISAVAPGETDETRIWNIVDGVTYPFFSWQE
ncbi:MAG: GLUG motif-containing protein, partial [Dehalococcoidia bacterium]